MEKQLGREGNEFTLNFKSPELSCRQMEVQVWKPAEKWGLGKWHGGHQHSNDVLDTAQKQMWEEAGIG